MWILVILGIKPSLKAELQSKELLSLYLSKYSRNTRNRPPKMRRFRGRLEDRATGGLFATRSRHFYFLEKTLLHTVFAFQRYDMFYSILSPRVHRVLCRVVWYI